jgi:hypothetical protein
MKLKRRIVLRVMRKEAPKMSAQDTEVVAIASAIFAAIRKAVQLKKPVKPEDARNEAI